MNRQMPKLQWRTELEAKTSSQPGPEGPRNEEREEDVARMLVDDHILILNTLEVIILIQG